MIIGLKWWIEIIILIITNLPKLFTFLKWLIDMVDGDNPKAKSVSLKECVGELCEISKEDLHPLREKVRERRRERQRRRDNGNNPSL